MKFKILIYLVSFFLLTSLNVHSQIKIIGKIINSSDSNPVVFAEIILQTKDSVAIKSELSNENGNFQIDTKSGNYILQIKQFGNILYNTDLFLEKTINLGIIKTKTFNNLKEVIITNKKKLIERKIDRLVFNVENSISATGGDALDALKLTPGLRVQNDQIAMIGKSGMAVMIEDKLIQITGDDLINYLKTIPSDNIKSIEVITTPPAKYDAQGNSGIVNIKLKKIKKDSWSATTQSRSTQATYFSQSIGANYIYQKNRLDYSADIFYDNRNNINTNTPKAYFTNETWNQEDYNKNISKSMEGNFIVNYQITPKTKIGSFYNDFNYKGTHNQKSKNNIESTETSKLEKYYHSIGSTDTNGYDRALNFNLVHKLDTLGKQISLDVDYFKSYQKKDNPFYTINDNYLTSKISNYYTSNIGVQKINIFTVNIDFEIPYKWANLNYGGKLSFTKTKNNVLGDFYEVISEVNQPYLNQTNDFTYIEKNQALYFSAQRKFKKKWDIKLGLRMESTKTEGISNPENQINKNKYIKLFPTAYISYILNDNHSFSCNYSRRIQRPAYWELNPAKWYSNLNFINYGNPFLQPSFSHNIELNHSYKNKLNTGFWLSKTNGESGQLTINQNENTILSIRENFANTLSLGWTEYFSFNLYPWWSTTSNLNIYYSDNDSTSPYLKAHYSGWSGDINVTNTFNLNAKKTFSAEMIYNYEFPNVYAYDTRQGRSNLDLGFRYNMLDKKLKLNLLFSDLLGSYKTIGTRSTQGVLYTFNIYNDTQSVRFSINYTFGSSTLKIDQREGGNTEEKNRAN